MKNALDKVIYVGKAKSLRARVRSYFNNLADHSVKTRYLVSHVQTIEYILTRTEVEAFLLEASLIKKYRPRYNIRLKDDKSYPYIRFSVDQRFPRLFLARRVQSDGAMYYGPYASGFTVRETIRFLNRTFKIRDCTDSFFRSRTRPCISHQIGQCKAPCVELVAESEYREDVSSAINFLKGRNASILQDLTKRMKLAAGEEKFEQAAKLRDSIQGIEKIWERQTVVTQNRDFDQDIIAFTGDRRGTLVETLHVRSGRVIGSRPHFLAKLDSASPNEEVKDWLTSFINQYYLENVIPDEILVQVDLGFDIIKLLQAVLFERSKREVKVRAATGSEGKKLLDLAMTNAVSHFQAAANKADQQVKGLELIQQKFNLPTLPRRIECFDISNFQGDENVASQVVFEDGLPYKDDYRRYKIKSFTGANDFAAMKEVLSRRFAHTEYEVPNLVVVDGGKGQLNMALAALEEIGQTDIPVVGIAKARTQSNFADQEVVATQERFFLKGRQNPVVFLNNSDALQILVGIRDEAHRFAITYHRKLRGQRTLQSVLDDITGLGEKRRTALLRKFGSIEAIRLASVEQLLELPQMNRVLAERILLQLNETGEEE